MTKEIQNLIDHPETIREALNIDRLDFMIRHAFETVSGNPFTMRYRVKKESYDDARFEAECEEDLSNRTGIFSKVITECKIKTFLSCIDYTDELGFRVWFKLYLMYEDCKCCSKGLNLATFFLDGGKWTVKMECNK